MQEAALKRVSECVSRERQFVSKEGNKMTSVPSNETFVPAPESPVPDSEVVISVRNISKKYHLYNSPQERMKEALHPFRKRYHREFWALRDISFEVRKGHCLGIIGRNGGGKSTLLQMICGVLQPTAGECHVNGRVSALLELGAGFNPEFTGRQNVYLNGSILGFSKTEMDKKFDGIAAFAEIGQFMDQPVKTYSSGMYVRLAFAVAISVDPDILVVDEALAVGDIRFQRKCYAKIDEFRKDNKTILFVSHSLDSVNLLCDEAILIDKGEITERGEPKSVVKIYQKMMLGLEAQHIERAGTLASGIAMAKKEEKEIVKLKVIAEEKMKAAPAGKKAEIIDHGILDENGEKVTLVETGKEYTLYSRVIVYEPLKDLHLAYPITTLKGLLLFAINNRFYGLEISQVERGSIIVGRVKVRMWLAPGHYFISFRTGLLEETYDEILDLHFIVSGSLRINSAALVNLEAEMEVDCLLPDESRNS